MISLKDVSKAFDGQQVLKSFSIDFPDGSRTALMGRSGSGKTTVLNLILGLISPDSGEVVRPSGKVGTVFQEDRLIESMSAVGNLRIILKKGSDGEIYNILDRLGIDSSLAEKPVRELSGGEKRRVAIARALIYDPEVIIMDEPFKGIDEKTLPAVIRETDSRAKGKTLILVTHSLSEAEALNCRVERVDV